MSNRAAYWLYNGRELRPFASYALRWQGRKDEWPRRMVHGERPTGEETVLDDIAMILRETPANARLAGWLQAPQGAARELHSLVERDPGMGRTSLNQAGARDRTRSYVPPRRYAATSRRT